MQTVNDRIILIVDDRPTNLKILFGFLQEEGFQVLIAKSGRSALSKLEKILPDLILLDIMMPDMDGFETCQRLKAKKETRDIPVIFMTALSDGVDKVKGLNVGGVDYITKPILKEEVLARINVHLKLRSVTVQMQYRLAIEAALAQVSRILAIRDTADLNRILGILAIAVGANRAYLTCFRDNSTIADMTHEWCDDRSRSQIEKFQNIDTSLFPWWVEKYRKNESAVINDIEDLPAAAQLEKNLLKAIGVRSVLAVPIHNASGQAWGTIGFETHGDNYKNWSEEDVQLLRIAGETIYSYHARSLAQEKLRNSEALYAGIFNYSAESIFLVKVLPNDRFIYETNNPTNKQATGLQELAGKTPQEILSPKSAAHVIERYRACIDAGDTINYEETLEMPGGIRTWRSILVPIRDSSGQIVKLLGSARDITEEKQAEAEKLRYIQELARSNAELEQFAYVASHDLQAPLATIAGYAQLLEARYKERLDAKANNYIDKIVAGVMRMQALIDDLLLYSRIGRKEKVFELCDCNSIFDEICANLRSTIRQNQASVTKDELPAVMADRSQLIQLFQNLIGNAIKYRREEPPSVRVNAYLEEDAWLFSVSDNGIGIDAKHCDRIFQIFQRLHTQNEYPGTGIGLAICQKIVERHSGRLWVESIPGRGSTFYFTLKGQLN